MLDKLSQENISDNESQKSEEEENSEESNFGFNQAQL